MLFQSGKYQLHSGDSSFWKIECDALTDDDLETLARVIANRVGPFMAVVGVPTGGERLANALRPWATMQFSSVLICDDVLTTGASMEQMREQYPRAKGVVLFARNPPPEWIQAVWTLWA